ncbi:MAG: hypothetical protein H0T60_00390 [Acidobacteria bacterium]|nr:hypothetical protein [Acidobacteriota bacterium]
MAHIKIPIEIEPIYIALVTDVERLHVKWNMYCQLYVSGEEIVDLLNSSAGGFFGVCQDIWGGDIISTISRLTDPGQMGRGKNKKDNLSLEKLVKSIDGVKFPELKDEIGRLLTDSESKCRSIRMFRHKCLGHNDLSTRLQGKANPLPVPTREEVEDALESIREVMNSIPRFFGNSHLATVNYGCTSPPYDGKALIARLLEAKRAKGQS